MIQCGSVLQPCRGACIDVRSDRRNCGACGHDCQGGLCSDGSCQPVTLASNQYAPCSIAVNTGAVYWANLNGRVMKCAKAGCNDQPTVLFSGLTNPLLTVDDMNAYAAESQNPSRVVQCAIGGCTQPRQLAISPSAVFGIAVDSSNVYFTEGGFRNPQGGTVAKCSISGCVHPTDVVTGLDVPFGIAVDSTSIYVANSSSSGVRPGALIKCSVDGCASPTTLASGQTEPVGVAVESIERLLDGHRWWNGHGVRGRRLLLAEDARLRTEPPYAIALDAVTVYWIDMGPQPPPGLGTVMKCRKSGCSTPVVIASGLTNPCGIAVDSTSVYWTTDDAVMKVAKWFE